MLLRRLYLCLWLWLATATGCARPDTLAVLTAANHVAAATFNAEAARLDAEVLTAVDAAKVECARAPTDTRALCLTDRKATLGAEFRTRYERLEDLARLQNAGADALEAAGKCRVSKATCEAAALGAAATYLARAQTAIDALTHAPALGTSEGDHADH